MYIVAAPLIYPLGMQQDLGILGKWPAYLVPLTLHVSLYCLKLVHTVLPYTFIVAAYTYYKSLCQDDSLKRRGKLDDRKKVHRRRERLIRVSILWTIATFLAKSGAVIETVSLCDGCVAFSIIIPLSCFNVLLAKITISQVNVSYPCRNYKKELPI